MVVLKVKGSLSLNFLERKFGLSLFITSFKVSMFITTLRPIQIIVKKAPKSFISWISFVGELGKWANQVKFDE